MSDETMKSPSAPGISNSLHSSSGNVVPVVIVADASQEITDDQGLDASALFSYLQSPQGHEIAKGILGIVQDIKKATLSHTAGGIKWEKGLQIGIVFAVIIAASVLSALGKLEANVGILFGTLVGYVFGRKSS